jgi:hypothetical protein
MNRNKLINYIFFNISFSTILVLIYWFSGRFPKGILFYIDFILYTPGFLLISILKGINHAMHYTTLKSFLIYSFIAYALIIGVLQFAYSLKNKSKKLMEK